MREQKTFWDFLAEAEMLGIIDFHLRTVRSPEGLLDFYIHPLDKDGETGDFHVSGAFVTSVPNKLAAGSSRPVIEISGSASRADTEKEGAR